MTLTAELSLELPTLCQPCAVCSGAGYYFCIKLSLEGVLLGCLPFLGSLKPVLSVQLRALKRPLRVWILLVILLLHLSMEFDTETTFSLVKCFCPPRRPNPFLVSHPSLRRACSVSGAALCTLHMSLPLLGLW